MTRLSGAQKYLESALNKRQRNATFLTRALGLFFSFFVISVSWAQMPTVVVAANMKPAMEQIYASYKKSSGQELRIIYGASGNFTRQIQQGAPFHLFVSADENFPLALSKEGLTVDDGKVYAIGRLALISKKSQNIKLSLKESEIKKIIARANKISLAKPEVAPYGRATIEFLTRLNLLEGAKEKFVFAENIAGATQYVITGAAQIGFTAYSLAASKDIGHELDYVLIPESFHEPIRQRMVLMKNAPKIAIDFYAYLQGKQAGDIIRSQGYSMP